MLRLNHGNIKCKKVYDVTNYQESSIITEEHFIRAPWLSYYHFNTMPYVGEDIIVPFYVSDYLQSEYVDENYSLRFLIVVNFGGKTITKLVNGGDNRINIGSCSTTGETHFSIYAIDLLNRYHSYEQVINLYVIDDKHAITEEQTYRMTAEDLVTYSIDNTNNEEETIRIANSLNINAFLKAKKDEGYRKVVMLNQTGNDVYRIDPQGNRANSVKVPSGLTLDGNGVTIKQHVYYEPTGVGQSLILGVVNDAIDTHVYNIKVEGDYDVHDLSPRYDAEGNQINSPVEAEGFGGIEFGGAFCSLKDCEMSYVTCYALGGTHNSYDSSVSLNNTFSSGSINLETGEDVTSDKFIKSDKIDLTNLTGAGWMNPKNGLDRKFITANIGGGYLGFTGNSEYVYVFYYDENNNYLGYKKGKQYALIERPDNTKYLRILLYSSDPSSISNGGGYGFRLFARDYMDNTSVEISNLYAHDTRSCAIAYGTYNGLYLHDCLFDRVAKEDPPYNVTKVVLDFEDGYQYGSNLFFENNEVINNCAYGGFIMSCGYNVILKNNKNLPVSMGKAKGFYLIGSNSALTAQSDMKFSTSHPRIFNNIFNDIIRISGISDGYNKRIIKNNKILGKVQSDGEIDENTCCYNCYIEVNYAFSLGAPIYKKCNIVLNKGDYTTGTKFYNCVLTTNGKNYLQPKSDTYFIDCKINVPFGFGYKGNVYFKNCILKHSYFNNPDLTYCHFEDCTFDIE